MRTADGAFPHPQLVYHEESGEFVHPCFLTPTQTPHHHNNPDPPSPSPTLNKPTPSPRHYTDINVLLQDIRNGDSEAIAYMAELNRYTEECGRIEMEKQTNGDDHQNNTTPTRPPLVNTSPPPPSPTTSNTTPDDLTDHPNTPPPSTFAYLETLRRDCNNGMPSAIAFMQGLREYTETCLYEQGEWEADKQAEIRKDHWIQYPRAKRYPNPRLRSRSPDPKLKQRQLNNKHHNNTPAHTPYPTSRSRPPPWPNKNPNRNHHNKPHYDIHTPVGTTTKRRPPPWPIIPSSTTILSIGNSRPPPRPNIHHHQHKQHSPVSPTSLTRPPPWPIISHRTHSTSQNCRNAKRRIKARSRNILDKVSS
jgi:hypothetical protein